MIHHTGAVGLKRCPSGILIFLPSDSNEIKELFLTRVKVVDPD